MNDDLHARALQLHREALVFDAHADTIAIDVASGRRRLGETGKGGHIDLERLAAGGVTVQIFSLWVRPEVKSPWNLVQALEALDAFYRELESFGDRLLMVRRASDLVAAKRQGKVGAILSLEGCEVLAGSLAVLRHLHRLGVRAAGLTWNHRNELADGVEEAEAAGGLTRLGRAAVAEMNRLGMVVDVSHLAEHGFWEVLEISKAPVIASHSNARAVCDHVRNLTDVQIRALARAGGVMGMNFYPRFLRREGQATLEDVVRHIDHIVQLLGNADHVGLGSDFDGISAVPEGLEDPSRLPALTEALLRLGYPEQAIRGIMGENFARVFALVLG